LNAKNNVAIQLLIICAKTIMPPKGGIMFIILFPSFGGIKGGF